jgi:signal transduction histidine kinase
MTVKGTEPSRTKVLLVDAGLTGSGLLAGLLAVHGFDVDEAGAGGECLRLLDEESAPEIVLLDTGPGWNGLDLLRAIRLRWPRDLLPVIAITIPAGSEDEIAALQSGANDHVVKPIDLPVLAARMRAALEVRRLALERRDREDRVLALLSHELRAPLTPMVLAAETLRSYEELPGPHRKAAATIVRSVELESRLIENLLDVVRIAKGKLELQLTDTDAEAVLHEVLALCDSKIRLKGIEVSLRLEALTHRVSADSLHLQQALWNLLHNAIKFTPSAGRIVIRSWSSEGWLGLEVADTGIGIEPDVLPRIFEPFEQGGREVVRSFGGLGLGLSITKSVAEAHGGRLAVRSEGRGQGATFTLVLPLDPRVPDASSGEERTGSRETGVG